MRTAFMAFQGIPGAYSQEAIECFGNKYDMDFLPVSSSDFAELFSNIRETGLGIVPIENSTKGGIYGSMDQLLANRMEIIGEYYLPIRNNLLGKKQTSRR